MAQIRNRFDIQDSINSSSFSKKLPNFFETKDEIDPLVGTVLSLCVHVIFIGLLFVIAFLQGFVFSLLPKPELPDKNIEFRLVQNQSKPPINKNTKIRSDRDSQAGGKHDPTKSISEPSKTASVQQKKSTAQKQQPKQEVKKVVQKPIAKPQPQKVVQKPVQQPQKIVQKPTPIKPSATKPSIKPTISPQQVTAPSAPKIATAPKSPFAVPVPSAKAPVGSTYKPSGTPTTSSSSATTSASGAPTPKFSSSGGSANKSSTSSTGSYASRGSSGGYGSGGNPSPGNPNGAPGIDAIRQPNWGPYMRDLEQRIKRNWTPPKGDSSKRVVITFTIGRDGRLLSHKVTKSSGVPLADRAAMSAIELTAPFRPLPPEFRGQSVPIEFTFDYNVLNSILR